MAHQSDAELVSTMNMQGVGFSYVPAPPVYVPAPPVYVPVSPLYVPAPPVYVPVSPLYVPAPPVYVPGSPSMPMPPISLPSLAVLEQKLQSLSPVSINEQKLSIISRIPSELHRRVTSLVSNKIFIPLTITHGYLDYQIYKTSNGYRIVNNYVTYSHGSLSSRRRMKEFNISNTESIWKLILFRINEFTITDMEDEESHTERTTFSYITPGKLDIFHAQISLSANWYNFNIEKAFVLYDGDVNSAKLSFDTMIAILGHVYEEDNIYDEENEKEDI
jgi:hypothetical protein